MRRLALVAFALAALLGCKPTDQASPSSIPNGSTTITKAMRGVWKAEGGPSCRWWIENSTGTLNNGNLIARKKRLRSAYQSQTVIIGSSYVGAKFKSDNCGKGGWTQ